MPKKEETPEERSARLEKMRQKRAEKKATEGPAAAGAVETPAKAAKSAAKEAKRQAEVDALKSYGRLLHRGERGLSRALFESRRKKLGLPSSFYEETTQSSAGPSYTPSGQKIEPTGGESMGEAMSRLSVSGGGGVMLPTMTHFAY